MDTIILDKLKSSVAFLKASNSVADKKPVGKIFKKVIEELSELLEKVSKRVNNNHSVQDEDIFSEIVDVVIQLFLLSAKFPLHMKSAIIENKIKQFLNSNSVKKYS